MRYGMFVFSLLAIGCEELKDPNLGDDVVPEALDADQDGYTSGEDCDDSNPEVSPDAEEVCDGIDNNCDGTVDEGVTQTFYADADQDGFGNPEISTDACQLPDGYVGNGSDCNDIDPDSYPSAPEICDGEDNDCNGTPDDGMNQLYYVDMDRDGFGDSDQQVESCVLSDGLSTVGGECDDSDDGVFPTAPEDCDGLDNDCDGDIDEGVTQLYFMDSDGDGFGDTNMSIAACVLPSGYVSNDHDCNDENEAVSPDALESCDGIDNDCDGDVDEGASLEADDWYEDNDGDGYGNPTVTLRACVQPSGYVSNSTDCNDNNDSRFPGAQEYCNTFDDDCDGDVDEIGSIGGSTYYADSDNDGYGNPNTPLSACTQPIGYVTENTDCDDYDNDSHPGAVEICDGEDNDCDTLTDEIGSLGSAIYYQDTDGDGFGDPNVSQNNCSQPSGFVTNDLDCDDGSMASYPGNTEVCDLIDNDCDGNIDGPNATDALLFFIDDDNDGYGNPNASVESCTQPSGYVADNTDCDDNSNLAAPNLTEICDNIDNDCNGAVDDGQALQGMLYYSDADQDGYGNPNMPLQACSQPNGYVADSTDCDDYDNDSYPTATEYCDGEDNDCDTFVDNSAVDGFVYFADNDGDGFGDPTTQMQSCNMPSGTVTQAGDCNDNDVTTYSGATEICDGVDNNCNGTLDDGLSLTTFWLDTDADNWGDSNQPSIEACSAPSGYTDTDGDCNDGNANISPDGIEDCLDGLDNDCSGNSDCDDWDSCRDIEPTCWVCGDGYTDVNESCDDNNLLDGDGCDSTCQSEVDTSGLYNSWFSEGRTIYVFQSNPNLPLSDYNNFCTSRGLSWFTPVSSSDAQTAINTCYGYDNHHTWIITDNPTASGTWNGHSVTVDSPGCVDFSSSGLSAIRKWACSYCDPESHNTTSCWDSHDYDWLLCEGP